jgi:hypothetical protein
MLRESLTIDHRQIESMFWTQASRHHRVRPQQLNPSCSKHSQTPASDIVAEGVHGLQIARASSRDKLPRPGAERRATDSILNRLLSDEAPAPCVQPHPPLLPPLAQESRPMSRIGDIYIPPGAHAPRPFSPMPCLIHSTGVRMLQQRSHLATHLGMEKFPPIPPEKNFPSGRRKCA